jgi:glycerol-3-phosphate dehydrogenase subunit C
MAGRNVPSLLAAVRSGLEIVFTSTSCGHMIKYEYSRFLEIPDADEVARHFHELFDYLRDLQGRGLFNVRFRPRPIRAAYFAPCHLKSLQIGFPSLDILRLVPELKIEMVDADCCGMGGLYGFKKEKAPIADAIGDDLTKAVKRLNVELVLTECEGCRMQIQRLTGLKVLHPIQLVRDALESAGR